jgi:hypothetical protein
MYFSWITVKEERAYFPHSESFLDWLIAEGPSVPKVREVLYTCRSMYGVDLFELIRGTYDSSVAFAGRPFQAALFVAVAHFFEEIERSKIGAVGFWSAGAGPAYVYSGVFSLATYFEQVMPFLREVRRAFEETAQRIPLSEVLVEGEESEQIEAYVLIVLQDTGLSERVFLKDRRRNNAVHLAGFTDDVAVVREMIWARFPGSRQSGLALHPTVAAHLPLYDRQPIDSILEGVAFEPPRFPLVTTTGEIIAQGSSDQDILRRRFTNACQGLLDTAAAFDALAAAGRSVLVVGTPFGAKVLRRLEQGTYPQPKLIADAMLQRRGAPQTI